jgi:hypothetical protein
MPKSGEGESRVTAIDLASGEIAAYITLVALLFESGPFFVSLQASNPVPYPIAAVRPVMRVCVAERRYMEQLHVKRYSEMVQRPEGLWFHPARRWLEGHLRAYLGGGAGG